LFYIRCPSCGEILANNLDKYMNELDNIRLNPQLSLREKEDKSSKLLDKYNYVKYCCRTRMIGLIPFYKIMSA